MDPVNRLTKGLRYDDLVPVTSIDHLLSDEVRLLAILTRSAIEELGKEMDERLTRDVLYPIYYEEVLVMIAAGMSHDEIRAEMTMLVDITEDGLISSIVREAYEDALAGRPSRYKA